MCNFLKSAFDFTHRHFGPVVRKKFIYFAVSYNILYVKMAVFLGLGSTLVVCLAGMHKALGLIPESCTKKK